MFLEILDRGLECVARREITGVRFTAAHDGFLNDDLIVLIVDQHGEAPFYTRYRDLTGVLLVDSRTPINRMPDQVFAGNVINIERGNMQIQINHQEVPV